jgi:hypothetical protein
MLPHTPQNKSTPPNDQKQQDMRQLSSLPENYSEGNLLSTKQCVFMLITQQWSGEQQLKHIEDRDLLSPQNGI